MAVTKQYCPKTSKIRERRLRSYICWQTVWDAGDSNRKAPRADCKTDDITARWVGQWTQT